MTRERIPPVREAAGGSWEDYRETHPAYAMIGASRVQVGPPGMRLFGSDARHHDAIVITIRRAEMSRGLSSDHAYAREELIQVAVSAAQWATFISTLNVGHGVECTLEWLPGEGYVPGIEAKSDRRAQLRGEVDDTLADAVASIDAVLASPGLRKADRERLEHARQQMRSNLKFVGDQFDKHAEETLEKVRIEAEAWLAGVIRRAGIKTLGGEPPPVYELDEGTKE